jgi:two-component system, NarL family, sensor histidine kinase UhpB
VTGAAPRRRRYLPLFARVVLANLLVLAAACLVVLVAFSPRRISGLTADEVLVATLFFVTLINVLLLRRIVLPVQQLTALARDIDPARPGVRFAEATADSEAGELALTFNEMLDRIEHERAESTRAVLAAQEAERTRVAQELHDEVGQTLTAVLLQLSRVQGRLGPESAAELTEAQETVRDSLEDVRRIATELRPETLADLGLSSALANLTDTFARRTGIEVHRRVTPDLPPLADETELALYRVAQEALTNVARHSGSKVAELSLGYAEGAVVLTVRDHGRGLPENGPVRGNGLRGMRERASAIGADLSIGAPADGPGSEVNLVLAQQEAE